MVTQQFRALIVDDDPIAREMVGLALGQENFICAYASDGEEALKRMEVEQFDLVVTDMCMPKKNGATLAVEILALENCPVIAVHSCIDDPRLTRDLITRGVDDIVYKPANYVAFAAKMEGLVQRRKKKSPQIEVSGPSGSQAEEDKGCEATDSVELHSPPGEIPPIGRTDSGLRRVDIAHLFPLSPVANEVYFLASCKETTTNRLAIAVMKDTGLTADVLRMANSESYNRKNRTTTDVEEAIVRIGYKKVSEITLALNALEALQGFIYSVTGFGIGQNL